MYTSILGETKYHRFIDKIERLHFVGVLDKFDMNVNQWNTFIKDAGGAKSIDSIYRAYKFGVLQGLRFAKRYGEEQAADIVRRVDQISSTT